MQAPSSEVFHVSGSTQFNVRTPALDLRLMVPSRPARDIEVHRHDDAHLVLVLHGNYQTSAAHDGALHASTPMLVMNPPRTEHVDCFASEQVLPLARFYSLTLSAQAWLSISRTLDLPAVPTAIEGAQAIHAAAFWSKSAESGFDMEGALLTALAPFCRDTATRAKYSARWVVQVKKFLHDWVLDGHAPVRMAEVAVRFGVHPVYLARAFRSHTGLSPSQYVRAVQLDKAAALLTHTRKLLTDIAMECLFFDQAHLTHSFRAAYGLSPSAFRAQKLQ